jgi:hypothetical protein
VPDFTNDKGIVGDSKLYVVRGLYYQSGANYSPGIVTSFNPTTGVILASSTDTTLPRTHLMKIVAYFTYKPSYTIEVPFTITF